MAVLQVPLPIYRYLDTVGDGSGVKSAVGDYSSALTRFRILPPAGALFILHRVVIQIRGAGTSDWPMGDYGPRGPLANGIEVKTRRDGVDLVNLSDNRPVDSNGAWGALCYDVNRQRSGVGTQDQFVDVRWTFAKAGQPLALSGDEAEDLVFELNDDFSTLDSHTFMVQGYRTDLRQ